MIYNNWTEKGRERIFNTHTLLKQIIPIIIIIMIIIISLQQLYYNTALSHNSNYYYPITIITLQYLYYPISITIWSIYTKRNTLHKLLSSCQQSNCITWGNTGKWVLSFSVNWVYSSHGVYIDCSNILEIKAVVLEY